MGRRGAAAAHRGDLPGLRSLPVHGRREHRRRGRAQHGRRRPAGGSCRDRHGGTVHRCDAGTLQHAAWPLVQRRSRAFGRTMAEGRTVACVYAKRSGRPRSRRTDGGNGCGRGGAGVRAFPRRKQEQDDDPDFAPVLDCSRRRPDRRPARRANHRGW